MPPPWLPASVRPALMTMIGLVSATSRAAERNDARVAHRLHVDQDAAWCSGRCRGSRSGRPSRRRAIEPMEMNALKPTISRKLQSRMAVHRAPLWLKKPTLPGAPCPRRTWRSGPSADHHAQAVRADNADARLLRFGQQIALELFAALAGFLETRRDDDRRLHTDLAALADHAGDRLRGRHDHGQIDLRGNVLHRRIGLDAEHAGALRVDREDRPAERAS